GRNMPSIERAHYAPPLDVRPKAFSVTEIETLRRDPYAIYAKHVLQLQKIEPLIRDPGAADRGNLFHAILDRFHRSGVKASAPEAVRELIDIGRQAFDQQQFPEDVQEVWWPRFERMAARFIHWERERERVIASTVTEARAVRTPVGQTGVTLRGFADRIDLLPDGRAEIIDYKTGSSPSRKQAHTLLAPQLALEGALIERGAFEGLGKRAVNDLIFVRLKANGMVDDESILEHNRKRVLAEDLIEKSWERLQELLTHFGDPRNAYISRLLPFRESDMDGDYDHLARVLEWSAGAEDEDDAGGGE
ncbi:double-strand break repair protein AddB, partial [Escherichia coli]|nr:double-strand break repair protein AddB [Escherichia coli]